MRQLSQIQKQPVDDAALQETVAQVQLLTAKIINNIVDQVSRNAFTIENNILHLQQENKKEAYPKSIRSELKLGQSPSETD